MNQALGCLRGFFLFLAFALILGALVGTYTSWNRTQTNIEATGVVISQSENLVPDGSSTYNPVIEFVAEDGETYTFRSSSSRSDPPPVGEEIAILYDPDDPTFAEEDSFGGLWLGPVILAVLGLIAAVLGRAFGSAHRLASQPAGSQSEERVVRIPGDEERVGEVDSDWDDDTPIGDVAASAAGARTTLTAEYRGVEPRGPDESGRFEYRLMARSEDGETYYSDWLERDPTTQMLFLDKRDVDVVWRDGGYVVEVDFL